jgi:hypothetical protein
MTNFDLVGITRVWLYGGPLMTFELRSQRWWEEERRSMSHEVEQFLLGG